MCTFVDSLKTEFCWKEEKRSEVSKRKLTTNLLASNLFFSGFCNLELADEAMQVGAADAKTARGGHAVAAL